MNLSCGLACKRNTREDLYGAWRGLEKGIESREPRERGPEGGGPGRGDQMNLSCGLDCKRNTREDL